MRYSQADTGQSQLGFATKAVLFLLIFRPALDGLRNHYVGPLAITDIIGLLILGLSIIAMLAGNVALPNVAAFRVLVAFVWYAIFAGLVAAIQQGSAGTLLSDSIRLLVLLSIFIVLFDVGKKDPRLALNIIVGSAVIPCLIGLYQYATGRGLPPDEFAPAEAQVVRAYGTFSHPNALAIFSAVILIVVISNLIEFKMTVTLRVAWIGLGLVLVLCILGSYTRSVWLALPVSVLVMIRSGSKRIVGVIFILGLGAFAYIINYAEIRHRVSGNTSITFRDELWAGLLHHMNFESGVFGLGLGHITALVLDTTQQLDLTTVTQAHNDYLRVFVEDGLIGFCLYFGAVLCIYRYAFAIGRSSAPGSINRAIGRTGKGAFTILLLVSATDNIASELVLQSVLWGIGALVCSVWVSAREQPQATSTEHSRRSPALTSAQ